MKPTRVVYMVSALVCLAQAQPNQRAQIGQQMRQNTVTVNVSFGHVQSIQFSLRPQTAGSDQIYIKTPDRPLDLSLRLPSGAVIHPSTADAAGLRWTDQSGVWVLGLCQGASSWNIITLPPGSPPGQYMIEATLPQGTQQTTLCATSFTLGALDYEALGAPSIGDWVRTDRKNYQVGDPVRISTPILDGGQAVRNAKAEAVIFYTEGMSLKAEAGRALLNDEDGAGNYVGTFHPSKPAHYTVQVTVAGRNQTQAGHFRVDPLSGTLLSGALSTIEGQLQAILRFRISLAGQYMISPILQSSNGKVHNRQIIQDLTAGEHDVIWQVSRKELDAVGAKPPFKLLQIHVVRVNRSALYGVDFVGQWLNIEGRWVAQ